MGKGNAGRLLLAIVAGIVLKIFLTPLYGFGDMIAGIIAGIIAGEEPWRGAAAGLIAGSIGGIILGLLILMLGSVLSAFFWFFKFLAPVLALIPIILSLKAAFLMTIGGIVGSIIAKHVRISF